MNLYKKDYQQKLLITYTYKLLKVMKTFKIFYKFFIKCLILPIPMSRIWITKNGVICSFVESLQV